MSKLKILKRNKGNFRKRETDDRDTKKTFLTSENAFVCIYITVYVYKTLRSATPTLRLFALWWHHPKNMSLFSGKQLNLPVKTVRNFKNGFVTG